MPILENMTYMTGIHKNVSYEPFIEETAQRKDGKVVITHKDNKAKNQKEYDSIEAAVRATWADDSVTMRLNGSIYRARYAIEKDLAKALYQIKDRAQRERAVEQMIADRVIIPIAA